MPPLSSPSPHLSPASYPLKHHTPMTKLWRKISELAVLENKKPLTMSELQLLGTKPDLEEEFQDLEDASHGWFEFQEEFALRVQVGRWGLVG